MGYISQDARVEKSQLSESTRVYSRAVVTNSVLEEDVSVGDDTIIVHSEIEPFCEIDRRNYIPRLVQSAEDTGNVHTLGMLHLVHQPAHICRNGIHAQCI